MPVPTDSEIERALRIMAELTEEEVKKVEEKVKPKPKKKSKGIFKDRYSKIDKASEY